MYRTSFFKFSIQTHIIARLHSKINPQFQKILLFFRIPKSDFPPNRSLTLHTAPVCQVRIFAQKNPHSKNYYLPKSGESFVLLPFILCEPKMNIHSMARLWKTPVEKPVESVENYELSTGIPMLWEPRLSCGIPAYVFA